MKGSRYQSWVWEGAGIPNTISKENRTREASSKKGPCELGLQDLRRNFQGQETEVQGHCKQKGLYIQRLAFTKGPAGQGVKRSSVCRARGGETSQTITKALYRHLGVSKGFKACLEGCLFLFVCLFLKKVILADTPRTDRTLHQCCTNKQNTRTT